MVDTVKILGALLGGGNMSSGSGSNILKSVLGAAMSGGGSQGGGGLASVLGGLMGGGQQQQGGGGLGGMLGGLLGGGQQQQGGGGLGGMLGGLLGGGGNAQQNNMNQSGGGLQDMLGGVLGGQPQGGGSDLGSLISSALNQFGNKELAAQDNSAQARSFSEHSPNMDREAANAQATLMIRAMINAAKCDGRVDENEQQNILGKLGSVTEDEIAFVRQEIETPLDVEAFARSVPNGMENQVYGMSLMAIDLDSQAEAQYLHSLAQAMNIEPQVANQIHQQMGAPALYS